MTATVIDLFAGVGWDVAARRLGFDPIGLELDADTCRTRAHHGMRTIRCDVATYPAERFAGADGLIASPPCQSFSKAGNRKGFDDPRGLLTHEPLRWVHAIRPRWVALEQVPEVLPVWKAVALELRKLGYSAWAGELQAEMYGVPQTRTRAILIARRDGVAAPPAPTHQRFVPGVAAGTAPECHPSLYGPGVLPWVSAAEVLPELAEWAALKHPRSQGMTERHGERADRLTVEPSMTVTSKARSWVLTDRQPNGAERGDDQPAPTSTASLDNGNKRWVRHTNRGQEPDGSRQVVGIDRPAPSMTAKSGGQWKFRPATTISCDPRMSAPGHHERQQNDAIPLSIDQAMRLQSFPPDFEFCGSRTSQFRQNGNAVPPLLAEHILRAVTGCAATETAA